MGLEDSPLRRRLVKKLPGSITGPMEDWLRSREIRREGWTEANAAVLYEVRGDVMKLHIPSLLRKRTGRDILGLVKDGFRIIADHLRTDENLKSVKSIEGYTQLAYRLQRIAEKELHFHITNRDDATYRPCS